LTPKYQESGYAAATGAAGVAFFSGRLAAFAATAVAKRARTAVTSLFIFFPFVATGTLEMDASLGYPNSLLFIGLFEAGTCSTNV
jgi:hypothetical protein